jgi:hypothetical protein
MGDFVAALNATGITTYLVAITVAFGAIALYFGFIKKS